MELRTGIKKKHEEKNLEGTERKTAGNIRYRETEKTCDTQLVRKTHLEGPRSGSPGWSNSQTHCGSCGHLTHVKNYASALVRKGEMWVMVAFSGQLFIQHTLK